MDGEAAYICRTHRSGIRVAACGHYIDEWLARIALLEKHLEVDLAGDARIGGDFDSADQRKEVGREDEADLAPCSLRKALSDLGPVPMSGHVVGAEVIRRFGKGELQ